VKEISKWYEVDMNNSKNQCFYGKEMQADLAALFKNGITPPPVNGETHFIDNFETGWYDLSSIVALFNDNFNTDWFTSNIYATELLDDDFDTNWFIDNSFDTELFDENFEDVSWDE